MFSQEDGKEFLKLAKDSINGFFEGKDIQVKDDVKKRFSPRDYWGTLPSFPPAS